MLPDEKRPEAEGAGEFLRQRVNDLDRLTSEVSSIFFGVNVSCAQCHDHPLVRDWKQDHFFGMKSFFGRTFENGGFLGEREFGVVKFKTTEGVERQARVDVPDRQGDRDAPPEGADRPTSRRRKKRLEEAKQERAPAAAAEVQRPRAAGRDVAGAGAARFLRPLHRQSPLASAVRLRAGDAARPDALGEPAEPSRTARLAGPRH